jgi:FkbM family methyltransferase
MVGIAQVLGSLTPTIDIVDVGAMWLGDESVSYGPLMKAGLGRVIGFEPAPGECEKLNARGDRNQKYLPYFVGDGTKRKFYLTNQPMTSSLYEPNTRLLSRFQHLEELTRTVEVSDVQTRRLDDITEVASVDFLKIDVQGAELDVIKGADKALKTAVVVQTEVEFAQMYKGQPLFADVDAAMRARGFALHTIASLMGRAYKPFMAPNEPARPLRQHLWGDAVYVKDYDNLAALSGEQLLKMAVILHEMYHSWDLASLALANYDAKGSEWNAWGAPQVKMWSAYMQALMPGNNLPPPPVL